MEEFFEKRWAQERERVGRRMRQAHKKPRRYGPDASVGIDRDKEKNMAEKTEKIAGVVKILTEKRSDGHTEITLKATDYTSTKALQVLMSLTLKDVDDAWHTVRNCIGPIYEVKLVAPSKEKKEREQLPYCFPSDGYL